MQNDPLSANTIILDRVIECLICRAEIETETRHDPDYDATGHAQLLIGQTPLGLQVWCARHDANVYHVEFGGHDLDVLRMVEAQIGGAPAEA